MGGPRVKHFKGEKVKGKSGNVADKKFIITLEVTLEQRIGTMSLWYNSIRKMLSRECYEINVQMTVRLNKTGGTGDAGFVIKLDNVGCVSLSHVGIAHPWEFELKCWKIGVLDRPENVPYSRCLTMLLYGVKCSLENFHTHEIFLKL